MRAGRYGIARSFVALAVLAALLVTFMTPGRRASSQEEITLISDTPRNEFPTGVTFAVAFSAPSQAAQVRLRYELAPDGTGASGIATCSGSGTVSCTFTLTSGRGIFVIPGAEITYHWEIEDEDGNELSTPEQLYVHEDTRFDFRAISEGNVTVHFHAGTEDSADGVLVAAVETLATISALENTQVTFPVKVFLYETADEMQPAIAPAAGRGVQILGEVVYSDTAMVSADVQTLDITRHELAHIVTRAASKGPFGVPDWMNEGISVYAQNEPLAGHAGSLEAAIRNDRVLSMVELGSPSAGGVASTVGLYYGQSGAIVTFLIDTYGAVEFAELIATFRDGATPDDAFEQVYGLDSLGIENAWRASVGLPARLASPTATPAPTEEARAEPTSRSGSSGSAAGASDDDGGVPVTFIVVIGVLALALAGSGVLVARVARDRL
jgi:peptidase MA superfamily protein